MNEEAYKCVGEIKPIKVISQDSSNESLEYLLRYDKNINNKKEDNGRLMMKTKNNIEDALYDIVPSFSSNSTTNKSTTIENINLSSPSNESKIEQFMSSMLFNAKELCSLDQYNKNSIEKDNKSVMDSNIQRQVNDMTEGKNKDDNEKKKGLLNRKLYLSSPLSNSDSHIPYRPSYSLIKNNKNKNILDYSSGSPTLSSSSSISEYNEPPKVFSKGKNQVVTSINKTVPNNNSILINQRRINIDNTPVTYSSSSSIDISCNQNLYNNTTISEQEHNHVKQQYSPTIKTSSILLSDHHQIISNCEEERMKEKGNSKSKGKSIGGLVKSSTVISMNPLGSLIVNDDGYYSHSPDPSKRYSNKKTSGTLKNSLTYHGSFLSPIKYSKSAYNSPLIDNQSTWLPNITRVSPSIMSESSEDDGKMYHQNSMDNNDIDMNTSFLHQTTSNINFLVDTSTSCLCGLLERYSNTRFNHNKRVTTFGYNIKRFFGNSKLVSKSNENNPLLYVSLNKIPSCFGMSLSDVEGFCEGEVLPKCIYEIMKFLLQNASSTDGVFRKSGVRSRIERLKQQCISKYPYENVFYDDNGECLLHLSQVHDVADTLKQYFREIPGKLFNEKISEFFIAVSNILPSDKQIEALRFVLILMDDVNRYTALALFSFLHKVSTWACENNMSAENLAVCFTPSLFHLNTESDKGGNSMSNLRLKRRKTIAMPSEQELKEYQSAQKALTLMIKHYDQLFKLPTDLWRQLLNRRPFYVHNSFKEPTISMKNIQKENISECQLQLKELIFLMVNDYGLEWNSWIQIGCDKDIKIYNKMIGKGKLLFHRASLIIPVKPHDLWTVINKNRKVWQSNVDYSSTLINFNNESDIQLISYKNYDERQENSKKCLLYRIWKKDSPALQGGVVIAERSIYDGEMINSNPHNIFPEITFSCFLIMPTANDQSKVNYIHRADIKGRNEMYYTKVYPKIICQQMMNLKNFFSNNKTPNNINNHLSTSSQKNEYTF
uniref:Rho-GAP domain-containing protein n=1 Tax=Parastrongyloides trichosuri TaxID=131310 RepID=A0A0N5A4V7_PARTI